MPNDVYHVSLIYVQYVIHGMISLSHKYISSVYSLFSDGVGLPLHNISSSGMLMNSIDTYFLRPDDLFDVNHMHGMQYQIVIHISFWPELN